MDSSGAHDTNGTPAHDVPPHDLPLSPPSPPAPPLFQAAPTEPLPQYTPAVDQTAQFTPSPAPAAAPTASSVVLPHSPAPAKRTPWLAVVAGVAILGLGAVAAVGWMGKADADDKLSASEQAASALTKEADDLRGQVEAANASADAASQDLADAQGQVSELEGQVGDLEGQVGDLEGQVGDLESEIEAKDAEIASLEETLDGGGNSNSSFNDVVLTPQEYEIVKSVTPIPPPPIEQARQLGVDVCGAADIASVLAAVTAHRGDFPAGTSLDDMAKVAGAIAGLMCVDHLQAIAG